LTLPRVRAVITRLVKPRIQYRITRGGLLFLMALLLTGAGAFLSANNLLFLVFSSMLALLLVSGFLSRLVLAGLEVDLSLPEHVSARTPTPAVLRIRNLKYLTPSFSIELAGRRNPLNNAPSILAVPVYFPLIPGRATVEANVDLTFPWRGRHQDTLFVFSTTFPFGFLRKSARVTLRRETIVYPALQPQPEIEALVEDVVGEFATQQRGAGLDFYRIRAYETTDSARLVDWKSTAHTGDLQVREFSRDEMHTVEIYLDRRVPVGGTVWFEAAVEQCAYLVWEFTEREVAVTLRSQKTEQGEVYSALRFLALVQPIVSTPSEEEAVEAPYDPSSVHFVFSSAPRAFEDAGWRAVNQL